MSNNQEHTEQAQLTSEDIKTLLSVVDLACQRGAFKPAEFVSIGQVYGKVTKFIEYTDMQDRIAQQKMMEEKMQAEQTTDQSADSKPATGKASKAQTKDKE